MLLAVWQECWCAKVFPEPDVMLADITMDVMSSLEADLSSALDTALKEDSIPTSYLVNVVEASKRFGNSVMALRPRATVGDLSAFYQAHLQNYGTLEEKYLVSQLATLQLKGDTTQDSVHLMAVSVGKMFMLAKESEQRCQALGEPACYPQLTGALDKFFCAYFDKCATVVDQLKFSSRCDSWTLFQYALKCLQSCGEVMVQLESLSSPLPDSNAKVSQLCSQLSQFALDTVFAQIKSHMVPVAQMDVWNQELMEEGTVVAAPLEYVTQIGQYLLTIPQHMEPFLALEQNRALEMALAHLTGPTGDSVAHSLLARVAERTMQSYVDIILQIGNFTAQGSIQLKTDIGYLCNVLDDLGLTPLDTLLALAKNDK